MAGKQRRRGRRKRGHRPATFADRLVAQLRTRKNASGVVYELDLRNREWGRDPKRGQKKTMTVFCPTDPGWPDRGRTTDDFAVAEDWVRSYYVPLLQQGHALTRAGSVATLRIREAVDMYLKHLKAALGSDHNTLANRRSVCRAHIVPLLGNRPLAALTRDVVRDFLENLQVGLREGGRTVRRPAKLRTRTNARDTLTAVWRHACPDEDPPFAGIRLADREVAKQRRIAAREGRIEELIEPNVYTRDQVVDILAAAMWYDRELIAGRPNVAVRVLPNTAEMIALQLGTAARIEEEMVLRWLCFRWEDEAVFIPGTKSYNAARWIPLQRSLVPWLERLRTLQGGSLARDAFVVRTHPARPSTQGSKKTYQARIARVLRLAGLKLPLKCTHIFRATHLSWGSARIPAPALRAYAGHSNPHGGAMDAYVTILPPFMPDEHRAYIDLPGPEEIETRLASFRPAVEIHS